ncbi:MAG TPA: hypothetical protein VFV33_25010 [Gemmatimonadaceae bacterium]|nr:hypothetical protein [Gemmatimonadaceae bacterium]
MTDPRSPNASAPGTTPTRPNPAPVPAAPQLDRAALERVLARAAELQAGQSEPAEQMSEAQLIEVGKEVGISAEHVRLALAEERTRVAVPESPGVIGGLFGAEVVTASRVVNGQATDLLGRLDDWMQREEALRAKRRFSDRLTWEARRDLVGQLAQGFNLGGRPYALTSSNEVGATVVQVDAQRCIVRLDASFAESRRNYVIGGSIAVGGGVLGLGGVMTLATLMPEGSLLFGALLGMIPALGGGTIGYAVAASHRKKIERAQLALEQVLDRLERGEIRKPANPLSSFLDVVQRATGGIR